MPFQTDNPSSVALASAACTSRNPPPLYLPAVRDPGAAAGASVPVRRPAGPRLLRSALHALPRRRPPAAGALPVRVRRPPARRPALTLGGATGAVVVAGGASVAV